MSDDQLRELDFRRRQVCRLLEQAAANPGMHSEDVCAQWRAELSTVDSELAELHGAKAVQTQRQIEQTLGHRFSRPLTHAGEEAIASARTELDKAKKRAVDVISAASREVREKAAELDGVMTEHGQVYRNPAIHAAAAELTRTAEEAFHVRG